MKTPTFMNFRYFIMVFAVAMLQQIPSADAQSFSTITYSTEESNFPNPERGFYRHTETSTANYSFLNEATLRNYRAEGFTLILRLFYLNDFAETDISEAYLKAMQQDFNAMRAAGVKGVIRFAYTKKSTAPYGDARPERVLAHINQLSPVLKRNSDVIAVVQAGFVGAWGEWYYTDHFSETLGNPTAADWENRRALVHALLEALPQDRAVQLRTPDIKFKITESTEALTEAEAFSGSVNSRLGHHNDCFLASENDVGTYTGNMAAEKAFLEQETQYLPMGGETCGVSVPLSECPNALEQMERFHWSYLNIGYHQEVLSSWESGGCMPEVQNKLGYRYRLAKSMLQQSSKPGGEVNLSIKMLNEGWANPYNPRLVEVVLREKTSGKIYLLPVEEDPRLWSLSDTIHVTLTAGLPASIAEGTYDMFLNLPDPEPALYANPDYSIRLANEEVWEAETGYNYLQHELVVDRAAAVPSYTGNSFFFSKPQVQEYAKISTNGMADDWQPVGSLISEEGQAAESIKAFNDRDSLYFLITGNLIQPSYQLFIDADQSAATGYNAWQWTANGADYLVENGILYEYIGTNGAWNWGVAKAVAVEQNGSVIEIGIPKSHFSNVAINQGISLAFVNDPAGVVQSSYLPLQNEPFIPFRLLLGPPATPLATSSGNTALVYWGLEESQVYRTLQRAADGEAFKTIAVLDPGVFYYADAGLALNERYRYRYFASSTDGNSLSTYTPEVEIVTRTRPVYYDFTVDGIIEEWEGVAPLATAYSAGRTHAIKLFSGAESFLILVEGSTPDDYAVYLDTDNSTASGLANQLWTGAGYDYLIRNDSLFAAQAEDWLFVQKVERATSSGFYELAIPLNLLDNLGQNKTIKLGAAIHLPSGEQVLLPLEASPPAVFVRLLPAQAPANVRVTNSETLPESQLIVEWQRCEQCLGYVVERSVGNQDNFEVVAEKNSVTFAYYDNDVVVGTTYYYRVFSFNEAGPSRYSEVVSAAPEVTLGLEDEVFKEVYVFPNPTGGMLRLNLASYQLSEVKLQWIDLQGKVLPLQPAGGYEQGTRYDLSDLRPGLYLLKISNGSSARYLKVLKE
ncbi:DUF4832 domain-containing protein [Cesiribacter sp. SM1]|uniref:DUF4832 domain-containing protein n=1 Tax=Cesiribacter sp. SM1 TaxID=2861196 RepID=UPI001CD6590E|nr:DUF4832 domain-containing protein [Cesiribacter sp. SM1]